MSDASTTRTRDAQADAPAFIAAEFPGPRELLAAARRTRDAGYRRFDVQSPFPVHGMDEAMGLGRSKLSWLVAGGGLFGVLLGWSMQYVTSAKFYPLIVGGKPYNSWPLWIIIIFELGVLFAAFAAVFGMLLLNRLPAWYHPTLKHVPILGASDNRFFLVIGAEDEHFDLEETTGFLKEIGGQDVTPLLP